MPDLSTFAVANETTVTTLTDTRTHIIAGVGSTQRAFVIDDVVDDAPGYTLVFCNNCYPQFQNPRTFTFGDNANETRIVEASGFTLNGTTYTAAAQVGRTTYFSDDAVGTAATGGRFRPLNQTHKVTIRNVKWGIESAGTGFAAARANGFHFGGGLRANLSSFPATTAADGMPMVCNGLRVYGRHGNSQMINKNLEVVNNETLGYGLRMELWDNDAENLTFVLGFGAVPNTQYTGFQLARYNSGNVLVKAGFQVLSLTNENVIPADGALTFEGADVSGADMFNSRGGGNGSMVVNFIDPVGEPGRAVATLRRGNIRIFRTQTFNYSGATFTGNEHLVLTNTTASAPSWTQPANLDGNTGGVFSQVLALKQMPNNSGTFSNVYNNYSAYTVGLHYRRQTNTFQPALTGELPDRNTTVTAETMADGSAIQTFTPSSSLVPNDLDKIFRSVKTHEILHPSAESTDSYMINNNGTYEVKKGDGTAGTLQLSGHQSGQRLDTTTTHILFTYLGGVTISTGDGNGISGLGIQTIVSPTHGAPTVSFPYKTPNATVRRINITGADGWVGGMFTTNSGANAGGRLVFSGSNLTRSFFHSGGGSYTLITTKPGFAFGRRDIVIDNTNSPLTLNYSVLGGAEAEFAEGGSKYNSALASNTYGVAAFSTDFTQADNQPRAKIDIADRSITGQSAYSIHEKGLGTLQGMVYLVAGGTQIDVVKLGVAGTYMFLGNYTQVRRLLSGNANAQVEAFLLSASDTPVDDSRGDVDSANTAEGGDAVVVDNAAIATAVVTALQAADFGSAAGTQTLASILGAIQGAVATDFDTSEAGTQTLKQRLDDLHASHGNIIAAIPTISAIVTAIQAADFGSAAGTQNLQTVLASILTAIANKPVTPAAPTPPTAAQNAAAVWGHASDIDTGTDGVQTPASLLVTAASAKGAVDDLTVPTAAQNATATMTAIQTTDIDSADSGTQTVAGRLKAIKTDTGTINTNTASIKTTVEGLPSATSIVTAVYDKIIETNVDTEKALQAIMAVLFGKATLNDAGNQVTWKRVDATEANIVRVTFDPNTGTRSSVTIL